MGGNNFCFEVWRDEKGKWNSDVISTFQAYQIIRALGEEEGLKNLGNRKFSLSGKPLVMRFFKGDLVRMEIDGVKRTFRVVKFGANGQVFFADHNEANVDARNADKGTGFKYVSKIAGSLQKARGRKVTVNVIGELKDLGFSG